MEKIYKALKAIAKRENLEILYACESGSRAWGFDSPDSDYDVRFIYRRPLSTYITIQNRSDCIDRQNGLIETREYLKTLEEQGLDIVGMDINKAFYLISRGNPQLAEWFISPIVYGQEKDCLILEHVTRILQDLSVLFYQNKAAVYHYEHMARKNFNQYILNVSSEVSLKKYLYVLRPVYACAWIELFKSIPPMRFEELYTNEALLESESSLLEMRPAVEGLIRMKREGKELGTGPHIRVIDDNCLKLLDRFRSYAERLDQRSLGNTLDQLDKQLWEILNV